MNKEVHYEGWLIKSPPSKRIWRARWRRRWFTLKQGEIPEQFCLEYYTDRNCRKLKGVIDLDQCEQVDCGLRLENRKQKFQFMFDIKTPKRTYYLAADTQADMRDWVNCICQVCHLHDIKQSNELQDENRTKNTASIALNNSTNNTTTTSLDTSTSDPSSATASTASNVQSSFCSDILRRSIATNGSIIDQQPLPSSTSSLNKNNNHINNNYYNSDCAYVNTEYHNRETLLCEVRLDSQKITAEQQQQQQEQQDSPTVQQQTTQNVEMPASAISSAIYLNSSVIPSQNVNENGRLAVNANGVVRKIPENLVLNNTPLSESQQHSVQPSPALSTASGPYIPISECFSGSPKFAIESNNPTTPLNNLDPKFYDTPRSHNNIGLNLTNDQSYSPKITNFGLQQMMPNKSRSHRSDSDSESVFTDDDEWTHPLPLRENVDRNTRPSDSSVENESFVVTYSQRFSKIPDDAVKEQQTALALTTKTDASNEPIKEMKKKNNLVLEFKEIERIQRDMPQLSDTENTSPAIGPGDANSVVDENYDIPRSHNLPYYNLNLFLDNANTTTSTAVNPIAASTPNLLAGVARGSVSPALLSTQTRQHCYTNAAANQIEGNVFRFDFIEQQPADLPPVNRKLKPKINVEDKPPEEVPAKPPTTIASTAFSAQAVNFMTQKLSTASIQQRNTGAVNAKDHAQPQRPPPSIDRKSKPKSFMSVQSATLIPFRRSTGVPLSMVLPQDSESYVLETRTLPRLPRPFFATTAQQQLGSTANATIQHQRTVSAAAAMPNTTGRLEALQLPPKNEHKLQYCDLDVANPPSINRQSMSVGNLYATGSSRLNLSADPSARAPVKSSVVYNSVDFVKTEAFKRIREERKKESEGVGGTSSK